MALKGKVPKNKNGRGSRARLPMIAERMRPEEIEFCTNLASCNWNIREASRQMEWRERKGYIVANRPRVTAFIKKMGGQVEKEIVKEVARQAAKRIVLNVEMVDEVVARILGSDCDPARGWADQLKASELAYKRLGAIQTGNNNAVMVNAPRVEVYQSKWLKREPPALPAEVVEDNGGAEPISAGN